MSEVLLYESNDGAFLLSVYPTPEGPAGVVTVRRLPAGPEEIGRGTMSCLLQSVDQVEEVIRALRVLRTRMLREPEFSHCGECGEEISDADGLWVVYAGVRLPAPVVGVFSTLELANAAAAEAKARWNVRACLTGQVKLDVPLV